MNKFTRTAINALLTLNCAAACGTLLTSAIVCSGSSILWVASAPFVSDQIEERIAAPILPAAKGTIAVLFWASAAGYIRMKCYQDEEDDSASAVVVRPPCGSCRYRSDTAALLPCAVHPGRSFAQRNNCSDWKER